MNEWEKQCVQRWTYYRLDNFPYRIHHRRGALGRLGARVHRALADVCPKNRNSHSSTCKQRDDSPRMSFEEFSSLEEQIFLHHLRRDSPNGCSSLRIRPLRSCYSKPLLVLLSAWFWSRDLTSNKCSSSLKAIRQGSHTWEVRLSTFLNRIQINQNRGITILFQSIQSAITGIESGGIRPSQSPLFEHRGERGVDAGRTSGEIVRGDLDASLWLKFIQISTQGLDAVETDDWIDLFHFRHMFFVHFD